MKRRLFIASSLSAALASCGPLSSKLNQSQTLRDVFGSAENLNRTIIGTHGYAREYALSDVSADFPLNSFDTPSDPVYTQLVRGRFRNYHLMVRGLVQQPRLFSLAQLNAVPQASQITRHDCVEGWSAIAQWSGVALGDLLRTVGLRRGARYVVFQTFDRDDSGAPYYESLSIDQAMHPQTLLALQQNGVPIPPDRGAPVRLKIPLQLGYKNAKWVHTIDIVESFARISGGKGGYWEDQGYQWYAGI